ncbi:MAG: molybdenum cofactor biosynthesis protein MoaE [Dehalococcoidia bacterium]
MILITDEPLSPGQILEALRTDASGSVVIHVGIVRPFSEGRTVASIEYQADVAAAEEELSRIAADIAARWQVQDVALCRRTGRLKLGEVILVAAVSAAHRREAFEACQYAVEHLKAMKSIAKREIWKEKR